MKASARNLDRSSNELIAVSPDPTVAEKGAQPSDSPSTTAVDLESKAREVALQFFVEGVKDRFEKRFPGIAYDSPKYNFREASGQFDSKGHRLNWQKVHKTKILFSNPDLVEAKLDCLHPSFGIAVRAILADRVLQNRSKWTEKCEYGLRLFAHLSGPSENAVEIEPQHLEGLTLHKLTLQHLKHIENCVLTSCLTKELVMALKREKLSLEHLIVPGVPMLGRDAFNSRRYLLEFYDAIALLQKAKVINPIHSRLSHEVSDLLQVIEKLQRETFRKGKTQELEPGIAALSDAITAMADGDSRLSKIHEAVLCVMGLEMCAPSRINEVLAMSIHDRLLAADAYDHEPGEDGDSAAISEARILYRAHAAIKEESNTNGLDSLPNTVLMKGSKGAAWGAKPVLDFMLVMFNWCFDYLIEMGSRSRMLLKHYEKHPTVLYLPSGLEQLRGKPLTRIQIGRIMLLDPDLGIDEKAFKAKAQTAGAVAQEVKKALSNSGLTFKLADRPDLVNQIVDERYAFKASLTKKSHATSTGGTKENTLKIHELSKTDQRTEYAEWSSVETELLRRVNKAIDSLRWVTPSTQYIGILSNMLMLFDYTARGSAYLPCALSARYVAIRLKSTSRGKLPRSQTVFEALDLKMPMLSEDGSKLEVVPAYCCPHDPRRWLTTMALRHSGPELSRLLINLWSRRADIGQLNAYDYTSPEKKAAMTAQAVPEGMHKSVVNEYDDLNQMLKDELIGAYKLKTQSIGVGLHAIRVTTMDAIHAAEMNHPVAKAGGKVILIFPTPYGICLHQHFEHGCTNYRGCGGACSSERLIKGHLPSNKRARKQASQLHDVIVAYVRRLILARNRRVVHDLDKLDEHLGRMIRQHMDEEAIATRLISDFLEIKDLIKDATFKADLEDAYAFKGMVAELDNPKTISGAVIHYSNPERHGCPEKERTIEALGGRQTLEQEVNSFLEGRDYMRLENRAANETDFNDSEDVNEDDLHDHDAA